MKLLAGRPTLERSGNWGARLSPGVGSVMAVGTKAKTMLKLIKHTVRVSRRIYLSDFASLNLGSRLRALFSGSSLKYVLLHSPPATMIEVR